MSKPDQKTTLREFHEYVALSYESPIKIATRIGVKQATTERGRDSVDQLEAIPGCLSEMWSDWTEEALRAWNGDNKSLV